MAQPAAVAEAVIGIDDIVGLVGITAWGKPAGTEPTPRPAEPNAVARRDADRLGIGRKSSSRVGAGGEVKSERPRAQPAYGLAGDAIPSRSLFGVGFWRSANGNAHRGRPWARATTLAMLGSIT